MTPKQRMLNAYRGIPSDRPAVAPEFWCYYPAKVLGVDMLEFGKTPFHRALKVTFEKFGCEGWCVVGCSVTLRPRAASKPPEGSIAPGRVLCNAATVFVLVPIFAFGPV